MTANSDLCVIFIDYSDMLKIPDGIVTWNDIKDIQVMCELNATTIENSFKFLDVGVDYTVTSIKCPELYNWRVFMVTAPSVYIPMKTNQGFDTVYQAVTEALFNANTFRQIPNAKSTFPGSITGLKDITTQNAIEQLKNAIMAYCRTATSTSYM